MKVIDHEDFFWFLFEHEGQQYLDVNCSMGVFSYAFMILLNEEELALYLSGGRNYLNKLASDIQYSAPIAKESNSIYKGRDYSKTLSTLALEAVNSWRAEVNLLKQKLDEK